jgi:hypothetical protein
MRLFHSAEKRLRIRARRVHCRARCVARPATARVAFAAALIAIVGIFSQPLAGGQSGNSVQSNLVAAPPPFTGLTWTFIGPQPTLSAGGSPNYGDTSGRISAIAVDQTDFTGNTALIGAAQGGVWRTTDGGQTWTPLTNSQPSPTIGAIAIAPSNAAVIYAATGSQEEIGLDNNYGAGILRSIDGGSTWTQTCTQSGATLGSTCPFLGPFSFGFVPGGGARVSSLAVNPSNASQLAAAVEIFPGTDSQPGEPGVYCSNDQGASWSLLNLHPATPGFAMGTSVMYASPTNGFAALGRTPGDAQNGIYSSTNANALCGSQSWTPAGTSGLPPQSSWGRIVLAYAPNNAGNPNNTDNTKIILYAAIADANTASNSLLGVYRSANGGASWSRTNAPDFCTPRCFFDLALGVDPADSGGNSIFAGGSATSIGTLIRSVDGGSTWTNIEGSSDGTTVHPGQHSIAFSSMSGSSRMYLGNDGGVWSTTNRAAAPGSIAWTNLNSGLAIAQFHPGFAIDPSRPSVAYGGTLGNGAQMYAGALAWQGLGVCKDGGSAIVDTFLPSSVYLSCALTPAASLWGSVTGGQLGSFTSGASGIATTDPLAPVPPFVGDALTQNRLYFGTNRVYQSNSAGGTWTAISGNLTGSIGAGIALSTIAVDPSNPAVVYTGAQDGTVEFSKNVSAGGAATFNNISAGLPASLPVTKIAIEGADSSGNTAYVSFTGFAVSAPLSGSVNLQGHVFKTTSGGASWTDVSCHVSDCSQPGPSDLPNVPVNDLVLDPDDPAHNTIYAATDSGVFFTANGGASWSLLAGGMPNVPVFALALHDASRILRAATHGRGAWDVTLPALSGTPGFALSSLSASWTNGGASSAFPLLLTGRGFTSNSVVLWNGSSAGLSPVVNSATSISVSVPASLLAQAGRALIQVHDATVNPGTSNSLPFSIVGSGPQITSISPNSANAEGPNGTTDLAITISGANFAPGATATVEGSTSGIVTNSVNSGGTQIAATLNHTLLQFGGQVLIGVTNPAPASGTAAPFAFTVNDSTPPPNDNFANATQITSATFTGIVDSFAATTESTDPTPTCATGSGNPRGKTVWWKFTASAAGSASVDTIGSAYDTLLAVYSGTPGALTQVGCNNDIAPGSNLASRVTFNAVAGTTYFFEVSVWDISLAAQSPDLENGGKTVLNFLGPLAGGLSATPTTATITAGGSQTFTVSVITPPFTGQVALTLSGCPTNSTCTFASSSVTAGGNTSLTVATTARSTSPPRLRLTPMIYSERIAIFTALTMIFLIQIRKRKQSACSLMPLSAVLLVLLFALGCGGGSSSVNTTTTNTGTPAGSYTLTITGNANTVSATTSVSLIVN